MSSPHHELKELITALKGHLQEHFSPNDRVEGIRPIAVTPVPQAPKVSPLPPPQPVKPKPIVQEAPPKPVREPKPPEIKTFEPEKINVESTHSLNEVRHFFQTQAPNIKLSPVPESLKAPPQKREADVVLLAFSQNHLTFLNNIGKAIEIRFGLHVRIDKVDSHYRYKEDGKLAVASEYGVQGFPELHQMLKESSKPGHYLLGKTPLMVLTDLTLYHKEPQLKNSLWQALCHEIKSLKLSSS